MHNGFETLQLPTQQSPVNLKLGKAKKIDTKREKGIKVGTLEQIRPKDNSSKGFKINL